MEDSQKGSAPLRVGFWLDWNGDTAEELQLHTATLELTFDAPVTPIVLKHWAQLATCDCELLTFDYGGLRGGYGPNPIVPALVEQVQAWCARNPDRLALLWCTLPPNWYLGDFRAHGGVPVNLRCWHYSNRDATMAYLRAFYRRGV